MDYIGDDTQNFFTGTFENDYMEGRGGVDFLSGGGGAATVRPPGVRPARTPGG